MPPQEKVHDAVQETVVKHNRQGSPKRHDAARDELLPHDRDEAVGATGGIPDVEMQQAHRDLQRGLRDTDRGIAADHAYRKLKEGDAGSGQGTEQPAPRKDT